MLEDLRTVSSEFNTQQTGHHVLQDLYRIRQTLLVAIVGGSSYQFHKEMAEAVCSSWGQDVSHTIFFVGEQSVPYDMENERIEVVRLPELSANNDVSVQKTLAVLKYVSHHNIFDYNWLLIVPLNTYVNGRYLQETLARMDPEEMVYLGRPEEVVEVQMKTYKHYCNIGTGVVLSRATVEGLIPHLGSCLEAPEKGNDNNVTHPRIMEGMNLGHCISQSLDIQCASGSVAVVSFYIKCTLSLICCCQVHVCVYSVEAPSVVHKPVSGIAFETPVY